MIKKRLMGLLLTVLFSASANAIELEDSLPLPWSELGGVTIFEGSDWKWASANIHFSTTGTKYVAFTTQPQVDSQQCISEQLSLVFIVNNQPIKGLFWCQAFNDEGHKNYRFAAQTATGDDYIINSFKNSKEPVHIKHPALAIDFYISAEGFTAEWNKTGDNAL